MAEVQAIHKFARISARKVRPFADLIRGMSVQAGIEALKFQPNRGAKMLAKVLESAVANAEDRGARNVDSLKISTARVDGGPMFKRVQPRARGMAFLIRRRTAHIHVGIDAPGNRLTIQPVGRVRRTHSATENLLLNFDRAGFLFRDKQI